MRLNLIIAAKDKASRALGGIARAGTRVGSDLRRAGNAARPALDRIGAAARRSAQRVAQLGRSAARAAGRAGLGALRRGAILAAHGVGFLIGKTIALGASLVGLATGALSGLFGWSVAKSIANAAQLEMLQFRLENIDGSAASAARSILKLRAFMANSPVDGDKLIEAYMALREGGVKPTTDLFKALQDASLAKNKDMAEAAQAYVAATKGEFDALEEVFGIAVEKGGRQAIITYEKFGKKFKKRVSATGDAIQDGIKSALIHSFGGTTERYEKLLAGMWGGIKAKYIEAMNVMGDSGLFNVFKGQVGRFFDWVKQKANDGSLERWATQVADKLAQWGERLDKVEWDKVASHIEKSLSLMSKLVERTAQLAELAKWVPLFRIVNWAGEKVVGSGGSARAPATATPQAAARPAVRPGTLAPYRLGAPRRSPSPIRPQTMSGRVDVTVRAAPGLAIAARAQSDRSGVQTRVKRGPSMAGAA